MVKRQRHSKVHLSRETKARCRDLEVEVCVTRPGSEITRPRLDQGPRAVGLWPLFDLGPNDVELPHRSRQGLPTVIIIQTSKIILQKENKARKTKLKPFGRLETLLFGFKSRENCIRPPQVLWSFEDQGLDKIVKFVAKQYLHRVKVAHHFLAPESASV